MLVRETKAIIGKTPRLGIHTRVMQTLSRVSPTSFVSTKTNSMKCFVNWIPLNSHLLLNKTQPCLQGGPEPVENEINVPNVSTNFPPLFLNGYKKHVRFLLWHGDYVRARRHCKSAVRSDRR